MTLKRLFSILFALALAGCAAGPGASLSIPAEQVGDAHIPPKPLTGTISKPTGAGPFPAVIVLHTCAGINQNVWDWQTRLNSWGYAVLVLDSFGPRGTTNVCTPSGPTAVRPRDRAGDAVSAALYLQTVPDIDANRIGVVGMSHGGATAALSVQNPFASAHPGLIKASVAYYGTCGNPTQYGGIPLLALAGEADNWGDPAKSCNAFAAGLKAGQPVEVHTYPGVAHSFEAPGPSRTYSGHLLGYDDAAAQDSFTRTHAFLDHWVKGGG